MTDGNFRWGLVSTARINRRLIPAIRAATGNELVAVASRDLGKAAEYATEWGISRIFGSYQEMLDSDQVDAVYISLPNALHAEWSVRAAKAGKHVLCEKPLASSTQEVDQIMEKSVRPQSEAQELLGKALDGLSDFFLIRYCKDLNKIPIPEVILKYETVEEIHSVDLFQMIKDFFFINGW